MKLSHALIVSAAIMVVAPVYAQNYNNQPPQQRENNDNQQTQQREVTTKESKRVAPRSEHAVAHRSRYSSQEERRITADLNRHGVEARDSSGDHRDDQR
jgi:hypothetical protein